MEKPIRIAIVGPECSGKTTLARDLAAYYDSVWIPEYAREYLDHNGNSYQQEDLLAIAKGQLDREEKMGVGKPVIFCDTNLIVIKVWSEYKFGTTDPWILRKLEEHTYDFYFLTCSRIPWEFDPQRENPEDREELLSIYRVYLEENNLPHLLLKGSPEKRLKEAVEIIDNLSVTSP